MKYITFKDETWLQVVRVKDDNYEDGHIWVPLNKFLITNANGADPKGDIIIPSMADWDVYVTNKMDDKDFVAEISLDFANLVKNNKEFADAIRGENGKDLDVSMLTPDLIIDEVKGTIVSTPDQGIGINTDPTKTKVQTIGETAVSPEGKKYTITYTDGAFTTIDIFNGKDAPEPTSTIMKVPVGSTDNVATLHLIYDTGLEINTHLKQPKDAQTLKFLDAVATTADLNGITNSLSLDQKKTHVSNVRFNNEDNAFYIYSETSPDNFAWKTLGAIQIVAKFADGSDTSTQPRAVTAEEFARIAQISTIKDIVLSHGAIAYVENTGSDGATLDTLTAAGLSPRLATLSTPGSALEPTEDLYHSEKPIIVKAKLGPTATASSGRDYGYFEFKVKPLGTTPETYGWENINWVNTDSGYSSPTFEPGPAEHSLPTYTYVQNDFSTFEKFFNDEAKGRWSFPIYVDFGNNTLARGLAYKPTEASTELHIEVLDSGKLHIFNKNTDGTFGSDVIELKEIIRTRTAYSDIDNTKHGVAYIVDDMSGQTMHNTSVFDNNETAVIFIDSTGKEIVIPTAEKVQERLLKRTTVDGVGDYVYKTAAELTATTTTNTAVALKSAVHYDDLTVPANRDNFLAHVTLYDPVDFSFNGDKRNAGRVVHVTGSGDTKTVHTLSREAAFDAVTGVATVRYEKGKFEKGYSSNLVFNRLDIFDKIQKSSVGDPATATLSEVPTVSDTINMFSYMQSQTSSETTDPTWVDATSTYAHNSSKDTFTITNTSGSIVVNKSYQFARGTYIYPTITIFADVNKASQKHATLTDGTYYYAYKDGTNVKVIIEAPDGVTLPTLTDTIDKQRITLKAVNPFQGSYTQKTLGTGQWIGGTGYNQSINITVPDMYANKLKLIIWFSGQPNSVFFEGWHYNTPFYMEVGSYSGTLMYEAQYKVEFVNQTTIKLTNVGSGSYDTNTSGSGAWTGSNNYNAHIAEVEKVGN